MMIPPVPFESRAVSVTTENRSRTITIATWTLLITTVVVFLARQATKFVVLRKCAIDDLFTLLATLFAIGLSVTTLILASDGLGRIDAPLTNHRANALMKGYYASNFFYVLTLCFSKLSLVAFFCSIIPQQAQRRAVVGFGIFIGAWSVASIAAVAFQCGLPKPWETMTLHCFNTGIFWLVFCIIDMTTDVSIIMLSVNLVAYLRLKLPQKIAIVAYFAPRIFVVGAALTRLVYLFPITPHDHPQFDLWLPVLCTQVQAFLSIFTACLPYMKPFFDRLRGDAWRKNDLRRKGLTASEFFGPTARSAEFQGHKERPQWVSANSTFTLSLKYGRTPSISPRIPSPPPLSPITTPRYISPANSRSASRSPSERGLLLCIPAPSDRTSNKNVYNAEVANTQVPSPELLSPQSIMSPLFSPSRRTQSPPLRSDGSFPQAMDSPLGNPYNRTTLDKNLPHLTPTKTKGGSVPRHVPKVRYSLIPPITPTPPPIIPQSRSGSKRNRRLSSHYMDPNYTPTRRSQSRFPVRSSNFEDVSYNTTKARLSAAPELSESGPSSPVPSASIWPTPYTPSPRPVPSSEVNMPWPSSPAVFHAPLSSTSPRERNHRILSPQNSSRRDQMSPASPTHPRTPSTSSEGEATSESPVDSAGPSVGSDVKTGGLWNLEPMPVVQDVTNRSSPRIVLQRYF